MSNIRYECRTEFVRARNDEVKQALPTMVDEGRRREVMPNNEHHLITSEVVKFQAKPPWDDSEIRNPLISTEALYSVLRKHPLIGSKHNEITSKSLSEEKFIGPIHPNSWAELMNAEKYPSSFSSTTMMCPNFTKIHAIPETLVTFPQSSLLTKSFDVNPRQLPDIGILYYFTCYFYNYNLVLLFPNLRLCCNQR